MRGDAIASITPALDGPANEGHTCLKGRFAHRFSRHRERLTTPLIRDARGAALRPASWDEALERIVAELTRIKIRPRPRRDRRPRLLARDERGLLRDAAPDARRDRHEQHRQLLARLPLPDVLRAAQIARPLGRDRLVLRLRPRRRDDPDRRQPDRGPPGRRRAHQAGDAARHEARDDRPAADRAGRLRRPAPRPAARHERRGDARDRPRDRARRPRRPRRSSRRAPRPRASRRCVELLAAVRAAGGRGDQRRAGRGPRGRRARLRARRRTPASPGASA